VLCRGFHSTRTYRHDLRNTNLQGYDLSHLDLRGARLDGAQMQGANLDKAQMQGADLGAAQMSNDTTLTDAALRGAAVRQVDDATTAQLRPFWTDIFADATLRDRVPEPDRPAHWPRDVLVYQPWFPETSPFHIAWRAWADSLDPPAAARPDDRP